MYYGGHALERMIDSFSVREDPVKLQWRKQVTIDNYENYPQEISDQYLESLKKAGKIKRAFDAKEDAEPNLYLDSEYREWFDKEFSVMALILPELYTQINLPKLEEGDYERILTKADEMEMELAPYPCLVFPQYVQNLGLGKSGEVEWISIREEYFWTDPTSGQSVQRFKFYVYDEKYVYELEPDGHNVYGQIGEKLHGFSECPFVRTVWKENKYVIGEIKPGQAMMYSIIKKSRGALSFMSMMLENIHFHLFPKLAMSETTYKNVLEQGIGATQTIVEGVDATDKADGTTRYIETSTKEIEILDEIVHERIPTVIYRRARLRDRSTEKTQSGFSKAFDMVPEVAVLTEIAEYFYKSDCKILELLAEGFQIQEDKIELVYPHVFNVKSTAEILQEVTSFTQTMDKSSLQQSPMANLELAMRIYQQMIPDKDPEWYEEVRKELENYKQPEPAPAFNPNPFPPPTNGKAKKEEMALME